ncbi:MAG TPA: hypothetical protein DCS07_01575 [Bdellovibrionales bacterium]|nr:MAG: hypothetical protein A2Z97_05585 [Bdellovibrionales bacterium GWB1_52_6]OFZ04348.1 MAG: hypothetical protein A2X97_06800 [Bdellovibrionales bacterium GWA1_52_35]OFZ40360.1 MAG: hypothetical protein A2070_15165 [Bdellovibrionales bacterium GWC1_52_8]HAR41314.1 hypothetical protein [Bdellovibrionales bacterium]HCM40799.1 hypothetical protein [Bdellovibrionales bacterium]
MGFQKLAILTFVLAAAWLVSARADTVTGYINLTGTVPAYFELWVRGVPGDLDLSPRAIVNDRTLGLLHLKYNIDMASLTLQSTEANGKPMNGAEDWGGAISYKVWGGAACKTVGGSAGAVASVTIPSGNAAGTTMGGGMDVHHAHVEDLAANFSSGLEEDCPVTASWTGVAKDLPLAGTYSMKITATMVSQ